MLAPLLKVIVLAVELAGPSKYSDELEPDVAINNAPAAVALLIMRFAEVPPVAFINAPVLDFVVAVNMTLTELDRVKLNGESGLPPIVPVLDVKVSGAFAAIVKPLAN